METTSKTRRLSSRSAMAPAIPRTGWASTSRTWSRARSALSRGFTSTAQLPAARVSPTGNWSSLKGWPKRGSTRRGSLRTTATHCWPRSSSPSEILVRRSKQTSQPICRGNRSRSIFWSARVIHWIGWGSTGRTWCPAPSAVWCGFMSTEPRLVVKELNPEHLRLPMV